MVVGSGIKFLSHITVEAKAYIEQAEKLLYLVNEPLMKQWLEQMNPAAESLDDIYFKHDLRLQNYQAITQYILATVKQGLNVCMVLYGHPAVFAQPALEAVKQARLEGYDANMLPGISAEDCLLADLLINPGEYGCQSFEATDLLIRQRSCDPHSCVLIWQIGLIGALRHSGHQHDNVPGLALLRDHLLQWYPPDHQVILYEASLYPHFDCRKEYAPLKKLPQMPFSRLSTLCVPSVGKAEVDATVLEKLGI